MLRGKLLNGHVKIRKADKNWEVRIGDISLGESRNTLELSEGTYPSVIYFPRQDISMGMLERSNKTTYCPHKGIASYYSIVGQSVPVKDAVWSYETPLDDVVGISEYLAFYTNEDVKVEQV